MSFLLGHSFLTVDKPLCTIMGKDKRGTKGEGVGGDRNVRIGTAFFLRSDMIYVCIHVHMARYL